MIQILAGISSIQIRAKYTMVSNMISLEPLSKWSLHKGYCRYEHNWVKWFTPFPGLSLFRLEQNIPWWAWWNMNSLEPWSMWSLHKGYRRYEHNLVKWFAPFPGLCLFRLGKNIPWRVWCNMNSLEPWSIWSLHKGYHRYEHNWEKWYTLSGVTSIHSLSKMYLGEYVT